MLQIVTLKLVMAAAISAEPWVMSATKGIRSRLIICTLILKEGGGGRQLLHYCLFQLLCRHFIQRSAALLKCFYFIRFEIPGKVTWGHSNGDSLIWDSQGNIAVPILKKIALSLTWRKWMFPSLPRKVIVGCYKEGLGWRWWGREPSNTGGCW